MQFSSVELLRFICCFFVFVFHCTLLISSFLPTDNFQLWFIKHFLSWNFAVPTFVIISGYFSKGKSSSALKNILIIVIFVIFNWIMFAIIYLSLLGRGDTAASNYYLNVICFKNTNVVDNFWYMFAILPIMLLSPLLNKTMIYLNQYKYLSICLIMLVLILFLSGNSIEKYFLDCTLGTSFHNVIAFSLIYCAGYWVHLNNKKYFLRLGLLIVILAVIIAVLCDYFYNTEYQSWWSSFTNCFIALGLLMFFTNISFKKSFIKKMCVFLGSQSIFIYLTQTVYFSLCSHLLNIQQNFLNIFLSFFILLIISIVFSPLINKLMKSLMKINDKSYIKNSRLTK